jgi:hypothetical protein
MANLTVETLEMLQNLWIQANAFFPINTAQISEIFKSNLKEISISEYIYLFVLFLLLYVLFSIVSMIVRWLLGTVVGMIKFGFYVALAIALYWIYVSISVSIDMEKGNEELRATRERIVKGAQEFVRDAVDREL